MTTRAASSLYADMDANEAVDRYRDRFRDLAVCPETLGWRPGTQEIRFAAFARGFLERPPASILDIGCGFGDLLAFLRARGWSGDYIGVDIVPEFVARARARFADEAPDRVRFLCGEFLELDAPFRVDASFASGLFNHKRRTGDADNMRHVAAFLDKMHAVTRVYSAFDALSSTADRRRDDLFFFSAADVLDLCQSRSKRFAIDHGYMPFEFMARIYWQDGFAPDWPVFAEPAP